MSSMASITQIGRFASNSSMCCSVYIKSLYPDVKRDPSAQETLVIVNTVQMAQSGYILTKVETPPNCN